MPVLAVYIYIPNAIKKKCRSETNRTDPMFAFSLRRRHFRATSRSAIEHP